jgi:hypothetical protein
MSGSATPGLPVFENRVQNLVPGQYGPFTVPLIFE